MCEGDVRVDHPPGDLEAGQARHLDVEEHDVRPQPIDRRQGLDAVARLADDRHAPDLPEQESQLVARQLLVVHQNGSSAASPSSPSQAVTRSGMASSGISRLTDVPTARARSSASAGSARRRSSAAAR